MRKRKQKDLSKIQLIKLLVDNWEQWRYVKPSSRDKLIYELLKVKKDVIQTLVIFNTHFEILRENSTINKKQLMELAQDEINKYGG